LNGKAKDESELLRFLKMHHPIGPVSFRKGALPKISSHKPWGKIGAPNSRRRKKWLSKISRRARFKHGNRVAARCDIPVKTILRKGGIKEGDEGKK
jgi:hypothetical protein